MCEPERLSPGTQSAGTLILDFRPQTEKELSAVYKPHWVVL